MAILIELWPNQDQQIKTQLE